MPFILSLIFTLLAFGAEEPFQQLDWLQGQWRTEFKGKQLRLDFTDGKGQTMLSTFKQVNNEDRLVFSRFMSISNTEPKIKLQLYPNLEKSKDHFVMAASPEEGTIVFNRVYADKDCTLEKGLVKKIQVTDIEKKCDRYPVKIVFTRLSDTQLQENLIGYRGDGIFRIKDDIERVYIRSKE